MIKAGIAYLVVAWLILQVISVLLPMLGLSVDISKPVLIILAVGFPIWLIIAWIYDFSPEGIKKSDTVSYDSEVSKKENIRLNRVIIGALSIAVILLIFNTFRIKDNLEAKMSALYSEAFAANYNSSIAILAFDDLSLEKDQEYFLDGLSRSIYQALIKYKDLKVISPTSSFTFKDKNVGIDSIGKELDVSYVLEGSVLKSADVFRININLVNTSDGSALWSKTFEEEVKDVHYIYDEISQKVAQYLKLTVEHRDVRLRKVDPEAYDLYLKAETAVNKWTDSTTLAAERYIKKSLSIDDTYAPAWSTLAHVFDMKSFWRVKLKSEGDVKRGIDAARKAIELDPNLSTGYRWLAEFQWRTRDIDGYQKNLNKVLELAPNDADAIYYAGFCSLRTNRLEDAYKFLNKARLIDPKNLNVSRSLGMIDLYFGNYDDALSNLTFYRDNMFGNHHSDGIIGLAHYFKGDPERALEEVEKEYFEYYKFIDKSIILYSLGEIEESDYYLNRLKAKDFRIEEDFANYTDEDLYAQIGMIYAMRGDKDAAFEYLDKSLKWIYSYPQAVFNRVQYKSLHDDPRWDKLLDMIGREFNYDFKNKD